jgi:hypothetical protein
MYESNVVVLTIHDDMANFTRSQRCTVGFSTSFVPTISVAVRPRKITFWATDSIDAHAGTILPHMEACGDCVIIARVSLRCVRCLCFDTTGQEVGRRCGTLLLFQQLCDQDSMTRCCAADAVARGAHDASIKSVAAVSAAVAVAAVARRRSRRRRRDGGARDSRPGRGLAHSGTYCHRLGGGCGNGSGELTNGLGVIT